MSLTLSCLPLWGFRCRCPPSPSRSLSCSISRVAHHVMCLFLCVNLLISSDSSIATNTHIMAQNSQVLPVIQGLTHPAAASLMADLQLAYGINTVSTSQTTATSTTTVLQTSGGSTIPANSATNTGDSYLTITVKTMGAISQNMHDLAADFAIVEAATPPAIASISPTLAYYPILAAPIVIAYRLDADTPATIPLTLTLRTIARIYRGNITMWNDPAIQSTNPGIALPARNITVYAWALNSGGNGAFMRTLVASDPDWLADTSLPASSLGFQNLPDRIKARFQGRLIHVTGYASAVVTPQTVFIGTSRATCHGILSTPFSMGYVYLGNSITYHVQVASVINAAGSVISPSIAGAALAVTELKPPLAPSILDVPDVSNPQGGEAWPFTAVVSVMLDRTRERTTCFTKSATLQFVLWLLTSDVAAQIAAQNSYTQVPQLFQSQFKLVQMIQQQITCLDGSFAYESSQLSASLGLMASSIQLGNVMTLFFNVYTRVVSEAVVFSALPTNSVSALQLMAASEVDAAFVTPEVITPSLTDFALLLNNNIQYKFIPAFMTALVPIFYLDPAVIYATGVNVTDPLYPLVMSVDLMADIFAGNVPSWTHPRIARLNPGLVQRYQVSGTDPSIRPVICCKTAGSDKSGSNRFFTTLNQTSAFHGSVHFPLDTTSLITSLANNATSRYVNAEYEANMLGLVMSLYGSISFKSVTSFTADSSLEIQMLPRSYVYDDMTSSSEIRSHALTPTKATLNSCAVDTFNTETLDMFPWQSQRRDCWPMSYTAQAVVPASYTGTSCKKGNNTLALVKWMLDNPTLTATTTQAGVTRVTDIPAIYDAIMNTLNFIKCDGVTMLITLPVIWTLTPAIPQFALTVAALGWLTCLCVFIFMWKHRQTTVFRSASVPSMSLILVGICTLLAGAVALVQTPTTATCSATAWLGVMGLTLTFAPLFMKTWRIYRIFDRKALHVVKISNKKLNVLIGVMLLFDLLIMSIWQGKAPVEAVTLSNRSGNVLRQSSQCQAPHEAMPYIVIIVVTKSILILFGALMGFTTRKVTTTFNESQTVAWSIYNLIFAAIIIVPILIIVNATEDAYILLQLFLVLWVAYCTLILLFAPKILHILSKDDVAALAEQSSSRISSNGFSFISTVGLTRQMLAKYIVALETQLHDAHMRMRDLVGIGGSAIGGASSALGKSSNPETLQGRSSWVGGGSQISSVAEEGLTNKDSPNLARGGSKPQVPNKSYGSGSPSLSPGVSHPRGALYRSPSPTGPGTGTMTGPSSEVGTPTARSGTFAVAVAKSCSSSASASPTQCQQKRYSTSTGAGTASAAAVTGHMIRSSRSTPPVSTTATAAQRIESALTQHTSTSIELVSQVNSTDDSTPPSTAKSASLPDASTPVSGPGLVLVQSSRATTGYVRAPSISEVE